MDPAGTRASGNAWTARSPPLGSDPSIRSCGRRSSGGPPVRSSRSRTSSSTSSRSGSSRSSPRSPAAGSRRSASGSGGSSSTSPREGAPGEPLVARITQQQLAEAVGSVREVVVRELRSLREDGMVETGSRTITLLDPVRLAADADEPRVEPRFLTGRPAPRQPVPNAPPGGGPLWGPWMMSSWLVTWIARESERQREEEFRGDATAARMRRRCRRRRRPRRSATAGAASPTAGCATCRAVGGGTPREATRRRPGRPPAAGSRLGTGAPRAGSRTGRGTVP